MPPDAKALHIPASFDSLDASRFRRLDDVTIGVFDCPHSTPKLSVHGPLVVRTQDIMTGVLRVEQAARVSEETYRQRIDRAEPEFGDLLYSREGTYFGIAAEVPRGTRLCLGQRMVLIRPDPAKVDRRYLKYWLNSPQIAGHIHGFRDGSVAERLNLPVIRGLPVFVPELSKQQAIAEMLGALDDKIEQNRRTGHALEELARATFKAWFVGFEPVKAKAAGQREFPGLPSAAFAALPDRLVDSPLGLVPQGWAVRTLAEAFDVNPPRRLSKGQDAPYLDMKNMPTDGHAPDAWERRPHGSGMRFINGDTLVARITPCLENGKTAFVDFLDIDEVAWGSTEYIVLRPKPPLPEIFAYCLARTPEFRDFAIQNMTGTSGRQRVAASALEHYHVAIPDAAIAAAFGELARPLFKCVRAGKTESAKLAALRDYLLPRLLSRSVRVKSKGAS